jgi:hypothetical protein
MNDFKKPRSLFFPLLLIVVGLLIFLINIGKVEGSTWDNLLTYWPVILILGGLDGLYKRDGWVGPLVLLGFGTILLLGNLGYLGENGFTLLLRLWPVLLVAIGLDIAFGSRKSMWSSLLRVGLGLALVAGILWLAVASPSVTGMKSVDFDQPLDGATESSLAIEITAGRLDLAGGADTHQLLSASAGVPRESDLQVDYSKPVNGKSSLALLGSSISFIPVNAGTYPWDVLVNSDIPFDLDLEMAAGRINLDLEDTRVSGLTTDLAVGSAVITLPEGVDVTGSIDCAVGQLIIRIPRSSRVSINLDTALVPVRIPDAYKRTEDSIQYLAGSGAKVELDISLAVGNLIIEVY